MTTFAASPTRQPPLLPYSDLNQDERSNDAKTLIMENKNDMIFTNSLNTKTERVLIFTNRSTNPMLTETQFNGKNSRHKKFNGISKTTQPGQEVTFMTQLQFLHPCSTAISQVPLEETLQLSVPPSACATSQGPIQQAPSPPTAGSPMTTLFSPEPVDTSLLQIQLQQLQHVPGEQQIWYAIFLIDRAHQIGDINTIKDRDKAAARSTSSSSCATRLVQHAGALLP